MSTYTGLHTGITTQKDTKDAQKEIRLESSSYVCIWKLDASFALHMYTAWIYLKGSIKGLLGFIEWQVGSHMFAFSGIRTKHFHELLLARTVWPYFGQLQQKLDAKVANSHNFWAHSSDPNMTNTAFSCRSGTKNFESCYRFQLAALSIPVFFAPLWKVGQFFNSAQHAPAGVD